MPVDKHFVFVFTGANRQQNTIGTIGLMDRNTEKVRP